MKLLRILSAAAALALAAPAVGQEPEHAFRPYAASADADPMVKFIDMKSLVRDGDKVEGWDLIVSSEQTEIGGSRLGSIRRQYRFDCAKRTAQPLRGIFYDPAGQVIIDIPEQRRPEPVKPNTFGARHMDYACGLDQSDAQFEAPTIAAAIADARALMSDERKLKAFAGPSSR